MSIGWGIIGLGTHADSRLAPAINNDPESKLVAVCHNTMEHASSFAISHGAEHAYDSIEKMLEDPELDVVLIATPNNLHAEQVIQAAEAGKHVLCEKPMALTINDCERMIETCNKNKVKLGVVFQNRYHPAHVEARRLIEAGIVGDITVAKAQYCHGAPSRDIWKGWRSDPNAVGAGALMGQSVHAIDLLRFLLDSEIVEVRAISDAELSQLNLDNMMYCLLKFENGSYGVAIGGIIAPRSDNDAVLYGKKAKITCKGTVGMPLEGELLVDGDSINIRATYPTSNPVSALYANVVAAFNKCIEDNTEPDFSGYNGLQMVKVARSIIESDRQGKAIKIAK